MSASPTTRGALRQASPTTRGALRQGGSGFDIPASFYDIARTEMTPAPAELIPILVGGHSDAAFAENVIAKA